MSIAVSAVVKPSRWMSGMVVGMCALVLCVGVALGAGVVGFALLPRCLMAGACVLIAAYAWNRFVKDSRAFEISVSGLGQIRLSVAATGGAKNGLQDERVHLLPGSTLWPFLLILHLQDDAQRNHVVLILQDSVPAETFRALLVACRWIVMRHPEDGSGSEGKIKPGNWN